MPDEHVAPTVSNVALPCVPLWKTGSNSPLPKDTVSNQLKSFSSGTANQTNRHKFVMCKTMSDKQSFKGNFANYIHFAKNSAYNIEIHVFSTLSGWREESYLRQLINMIFFMTCEHHTMSLTVFCGISKKRWHGQRTVSGQDNGLCGAHGISIPEVLLSFLWRPNQWIFKAVWRNSQADLVIGLNSSLSTRTQTTFSVDI